MTRFKGLNRIWAKGRRYIYLRATGYRFQAAEGTPEFLAEYLAQAAAVAARPKAQTLGALIDSYRAGPEFRALAARTRIDYDRVFDYLKPNRDMPLDSITAAYVLGVRDRAFQRHKRRFANYCVQVLHLVFEWARPRDFLTFNPAHKVPRIKRPRSLPRANRPWTPREEAIVLDRAPATLKPAIALGMFAGLREGDAVRFPWSGYDGARIRYRQAKTGGEVEITADPRLRAILDAAPRVSPIVATSSAGRPWTLNAFRAAFFGLIRTLAAEGAIGPGLTFHGLRHTVGQRLAEAGADTRTIAAVLGHSSEAMARHYSETEDRRRRTAEAARKVTRLERKRAAVLQNPRTNSAKPPGGSDDAAG